MLCCQECTLETDATLTTVLFIDQLAVKRQQTLTQYAQKQQRKMRNRNVIRQMERAGGNIYI
jgi:uncharacterized membrane protein (DUF106 family)